MLITIFTYNREEMLAQRLEELKGYNILIIDDASNYDISKYKDKAFIYSAPINGGKQLYYKQWQTALHLIEGIEDDLFIFTADDFANLDIRRIEKLHNYLTPGGPYLVNLINDGRTLQFVNHTPQRLRLLDEEVLKVGFTDCGFFCNRATLEALNFTVPDVDAVRFKNNPHISSGVGQNLSRILYGKKIPLYLPLNSFAYHGSHDSVMHPEERKRNPLISINVN